MARLISRLLDAVAPRVCSGCEGGSGTILDQSRGVIRPCHLCGGTGKAPRSGGRDTAESLLSERLTEAAERARTKR